MPSLHVSVPGHDVMSVMVSAPASARPTEELLTTRQVASGPPEHRFGRRSAQRAPVTCASSPRAPFFGGKSPRVVSLPRIAGRLCAGVRLPGGEATDVRRLPARAWLERSLSVACSSAKRRPAPDALGRSRTSAELFEPQLLHQKLMRAGALCARRAGRKTPRPGIGALFG